MDATERSCGVCGGAQALIRGKVPGDDTRIVCPTCLRDALDLIHETSSPEYGRQFAATSDGTG